MKRFPCRGLFAAGLVAGLVVSVHGQIVELRATVDQSQETPATGSSASGSAIMLYDVAHNTFDLTVAIHGLPNAIADSHIHEAAVGTAGGVVNALGADAVYTRNGDALTATFHDLTYGGSPATLLSGGAYYNVHTAAFPKGEIRGQLIPQPKRLYATLTVAQAQATASGTISSNANGAAVFWYDPMTKTVTTRVSLYRFANTLANSHLHEAAAGASGGVVLPLGGAASYATDGAGHYDGAFSGTYNGDPVKLLTGGAYINVHSNLYPAGEIRGQVMASDELPSSRVVNVSARGAVAGGERVLIGGFSVAGPEPLRVLITAKGPSLAEYGVTGPLSDPVVTLYDSSGHAIAWNNDVGTPTAGSDLAGIAGVPENSAESALLIVLPPGVYSAVVSGNAGSTGVALLEVTDLR